MSTSLLYHGFGVRGYRYVKTEYVEGGMVLHRDAATRSVSLFGLWVEQTFRRVASARGGFAACRSAASR